MRASLNPENGTSLTKTVDVTAHSISLFQENEQPKNVNDTLAPKTDISIAEPIEVQIGELGNNTIQMYQPIGITDDENVGGLEPLLNYMNENCSSKDDPAINEHHCNITKDNTTKRHITHRIYIKPKHNRYTDEHCYNNKQNVNNNITNNISKRNHYL